eukprot:PhM_4_TR8630/c0_g1_i1/m.67938
MYTNMVPDVAPNRASSSSLAKTVVLVGGGVALASVCVAAWRGFLTESLQQRRDRTLVFHVAGATAATVEQIRNDCEMLGSSVSYRSNLALHVATCEVNECTGDVLALLLSHGARNEVAGHTRVSYLFNEGTSSKPIPPYLARLLCDGIRQTPLHRLLRACRRQYETDAVFSLKWVEHCLLAMKSGANVNELDATGQTALHLAVAPTKKPSERFGSVALGLLLEDTSVEVNKPRRSDDNTALHIIAGRIPTTSDPSNLLPMLRVLLQVPSLHVNAENKDGDTPLHLVVRGYTQTVNPADTPTDARTRWEALLMLLRRGANPMLPNHARVQAYQIASEAHLTELCRVLKESVDSHASAMRDVEVVYAGELA